MKKIYWISAVVVLLLIIVAMNNKIVLLDENKLESWAEVENQLQRRNDLIPNLVSTVKGYAKHEKELFAHIADARAKLGGTINSGAPIGEKIGAANELSSALSRLLVVVERYPDLKAQTNFARLQDELAGTENRLTVARRRYNEVVKLYNSYIRRFPGSLLAMARGLQKAVYFDVEDKAKEVPSVSFE